MPSAPLARRPRADRAHSSEGEAARRIAASVRSAEQSLDDLAATGAAEVLFVRHARGGSPEVYLDTLADRALALGFAVATVRVMTECAFDTLASVVEATINALHAPGSGRRPGL